MSLPKILFKPQSTLADAVHKVPGQTDAAADYGDRVSDESERLSSLVALVTPYLEACLGDIPTVPNPNVTAATDHKSQLEMILESQTSTPITSINALVVEHLLFNFGKLQVRGVCSGCTARTSSSVSSTARSATTNESPGKRQVSLQRQRRHWGWWSLQPNPQLSSVGAPDTDLIFVGMQHKVYTVVAATLVKLGCSQT